MNPRPQHPAPEGQQPSLNWPIPQSPAALRPSSKLWADIWRRYATPEEGAAIAAYYEVGEDEWPEALMVEVERAMILNVRVPLDGVPLSDDPQFKAASAAYRAIYNRIPGE
jgi:hypothetical protein